MYYKEMWESIGRFFYTANFSILISGLIVWDTNLLDLIPGIIHLEPRSFLIFFGVLFLLAYYIIDWLDANLVSSIDKEVRLKDIVFWLLAPISLSLILTLLLKKREYDSFSSWLYLGFNLYIIFNALILSLRKKLIDYEVSDDLYGKETKKNEYNKLISVHIFEKILVAIHIILFLLANGNLIFQMIKTKECELRVLLKECELMILIVFVSIILLNLFLKCYRYKNVNLVYYNKVKKERRQKDNH